MIKIINRVLLSFRECFRRSATFKWFVAVVIGMMIRSDNLGVTSIIRALGLAHKYEPLNNYFRSNAWSLSFLEKMWCKITKENAPLFKIRDSVVLAGDGIKVSKEGKRMPAVKRLFQDSENSAKATSIYGQMYGCVGVLAENGGKTYCIPLACEIQDGAKEIMSWGEKYGHRQGSHTVELVSLAHRMTEVFPNAILLLDRYFLTMPALERLDAYNAGGGNLSAIIMAKSNAVGYEPLAMRKTKTKGRPKIKGKTVKLAELFDKETDKFEYADAVIYGKKVRLRYLVKDLLWGQGLYRLIRFVLVDIDGKRVIISSTSTAIEPIEIIELYAKRFTIECTFKAMKHVVAAFSNRFWSKFMPKLRRYAKSGEADRVTKIITERGRQAVRKSLDATEGYIFCGAVAVGLLQMLSLSDTHKNECGKIRYLRTLSNTALSEATINEYLQKNIFRLLAKEPDLAITKIIQSKMCIENNDFEDRKAG